MAQDLSCLLKVMVTFITWAQKVNKCLYILIGVIDFLRQGDDLGVKIWFLGVFEDISLNHVAFFVNFM